MIITELVMSSPEVQCRSSVDAPPCSTKYWKLYKFMVTVPQRTSNHHISHHTRLLMHRNIVSMKSFLFTKCLFVLVATEDFLCEAEVGEWAQIPPFGHPGVPSCEICCWWRVLRQWQYLWSLLLVLLWPSRVPWLPGLYSECFGIIMRFWEFLNLRWTEKWIFTTRWFPSTPAFLIPLQIIMSGNFIKQHHNLVIWGWKYKDQGPKILGELLWPVWMISKHKKVKLHKNKVTIYF